MVHRRCCNKGFRDELCYCKPDVTTFDLSLQGLMIPAELHMTEPAERVSSIRAASAEQCQRTIFELTEEAKATARRVTVSIDGPRIETDTVTGDIYYKARVRYKF